MEHNMACVFVIVVAVLALLKTSEALQCVDCKDATCVPPPPSCEPGRRPCSCCMECRIGLGGECGPFSPECLSSLICLTNIGAYNGRPPYWLNVVGQCVYPSMLRASTAPVSQLTPTLPASLVKMLALRRK